MFDFARDAAESLYDSTADVWGFKDDGESNSVFAEDKLKPIKVYKEQPCRVSKKTIGATQGGEIQHETVLFISPDLDIAPGSRVTVTNHRGEVMGYVGTGSPFKYATHQEITLLKDGMS